MNNKQFLLETDVIIDYLNFNGNRLESKLIKFLSEGKCFTTILNASELYFHCKDETQFNAVNKFLFSINILGLHPRYSLKVSEFSYKFSNVRDCLFYLVAFFNNLVIVTKHEHIFPEGNVEIILL
jgi:hypothetical protein